MRRLYLIAAIGLMTALPSVSQAQCSPQDKDDASRSAKTSPKPDAAPVLKITHGPTVEFSGADRAIVAWSTNISGATIVHYGTDPSDLSKKAMAPWGALTHRVTLKNLQPNKTYYFKVDSMENGSLGESKVQQFQTKGSNQSASN